MHAETRSFIALLAVFLFSAFVPGVARAQSYDLSVTRTAGDFYKVVGKDIVIQTRRCDVVATAKSSVFTSDAQGSKLLFVEGGQDCDVKAAYGPTMAHPGQFTVTVNHDADDWYEVFGASASTYVRTSSCAQAAGGQQATLSLGAANAGRLEFGDGTSCQVEGVYDKLRI